MQSITVNKLHAAKLQLETAIELFFDDGDPISIHTLTCAAYDLIDGVNEHRGGKEMWVKRRFPKLPGRPTHKDLRESQNFLKHADRDPEGTLEYFPKMAEPMLADACRTYFELTGEKHALFEVMLRWFHCHGGNGHFDWPDEKQGLLNDLLELFKSGNRAGFLARCALP